MAAANGRERNEGISRIRGPCIIGLRHSPVPIPAHVRSSSLLGTAHVGGSRRPVLEPKVLVKSQFLAKRVRSLNLYLWR